MIVAIASENKPKVSACKNVFSDLKNEFSTNEDLSFIVRNIESGVAEMPLSLDELMTGAKNRTEKLHSILKNENRPADYYIGLEGGFFLKYNFERSNHVVFLESWVYAFNGAYGYWGSSGAIEVPQNISDDILKSNKELGVVIDQKMKQTDIRSNQGTVGILTNNKITRQDFFESALIFALAPFYNSQMYN
jgi:inosine/xanthosine triphosphatase